MIVLGAEPVASSTVAMVTQAIAAEEVPTVLHPKVTHSTASSILIKWTWDGLHQAYVRGFKVNFWRVQSAYVQSSDMLPSDVHSYGINNLVADTYYKVCVSMYRNDTSAAVQKCVDAATTSWHIPVSIGSSIGAVLALSIIVLIVLMSRCPNLIRKQRTAAAESSKYDSMSSHFPDDRYEMSDTTTPCHDKDDEAYSPSEGDSLTDTTRDSPKQSLHSPQSLAERLCNGSSSRPHNGVSRPGGMQRVPLAKCGRAMSLQDRKQQHKVRQMRLAHLHANFHSIQSEPGSSPSPRLHGADFPSSTPVKDLQSSPKATHHSSLPSSSCGGFNRQLAGGCTTGCGSKPAGYRDGPRLLYRIESGTSSSEPVVISKSATDGREDGKASTSSSGSSSTRKPALKAIGRTFHMSIDGDTMV